MKPNDTVYCGMNRRLLFRSVYHRFESPLSTSTALEVAQRFAARNVSAEGGIILKLKRSNSKTRYFDVAPFSAHPKEKEWLFMGSTLKIVGIALTKGKRQFFTTIMAALLMFEQIINGRFVDDNKNGRGMLLGLLRRASEESVFDSLRTSKEAAERQLDSFLQEESYDTDAILMDIDRTDCSFIGQFVSDKVMTKKIINSIHKIHGMFIMLLAIVAVLLP